MRMTRMKTNRQIALSCLAIMAATMVVDGAVRSALAQNPFGGPPAAPDAQAGGIVGWLLTKQSGFYREISSTIRAAKADGSAVWTLLAISFAYGMFHAAGPGHGKTVISSYLVANEETARRGSHHRLRHSRYSDVVSSIPSCGGCAGSQLRSIEFSNICNFCVILNAGGSMVQDPFGERSQQRNCLPFPRWWSALPWPCDRLESIFVSRGGTGLSGQWGMDGNRFSVSHRR